MRLSAGRKFDFQNWVCLKIKKIKKLKTIFNIPQSLTVHGFVFRKTYFQRGFNSIIFFVILWSL